MQLLKAQAMVFTHLCCRKKGGNKIKCNNLFAGTGPDFTETKLVSEEEVNFIKRLNASIISSLSSAKLEKFVECVRISNM